MKIIPLRFKVSKAKAKNMRYVKARNDGRFVSFDELMKGEVYL